MSTEENRAIARRWYDEGISRPIGAGVTCITAPMPVDGVYYPQRLDRRALSGDRDLDPEVGVR